MIQIIIKLTLINHIISLAERRKYAFVAYNIFFIFTASILVHCVWYQPHLLVVWQDGIIYGVVFLAGHLENAARERVVRQFLEGHLTNRLHKVYLKTIVPILIQNIINFTITMIDT